MNKKVNSSIESNYRALYGKLFSALISKFGVNYVNEIEDAIQNSFYKALKTWQTNKIPDKQENWLFIVAKNDVINQIKRRNKSSSGILLNEEEENITEENDLRLQTILFLSASKTASSQAKIIFILKNVFGLNIREISENTLLSQDAIYKSINRAKKNLQIEFENKQLHSITNQAGKNEIDTVEEILYAVFNIGFDSFDDKIKSIINEDLCLEALALTKLLLREHQQATTRSLLALFCFHIARIPAKVINGKLVSFLEQNQAKWDKRLIELGFSYLQKPEKLNRFYIEALIAAKYMTAQSYDNEHWQEIVKLYKLLIEHHNSQIIKLNLCYSLYKAQRKEEALELMGQIENVIPSGHIYFSLVKAELSKDTEPEKSGKIMASVIDKMEQNIRKEYLLEKGYITP
ncbi:hypothetical protein OO013_17060 [Mangrovivirga sp. M17]|uniref:RNA polymerase n=1 Tax=Mangrovivirga halotolerans TaxID=2993936 RepID=A0ABT3RV01_9BACT|nr:DUF6596 domain-containing protein [Mangrovivirga halotolerans]MCX2745594.1 hypothetical protein [Mangrovivirga halotolerans]